MRLGSACEVSSLVAVSLSSLGIISAEFVQAVAWAT